MRFASGLVAFLLLSVTPSLAAANSLQGKNTCAYDGANPNICFPFDRTSGLFAAQTYDFKATGPGRALVSVTGSGSCINQTADIKSMTFDTQIMDVPAAHPSYRGPGGNRFELQ